MKNSFDHQVPTAEEAVLIGEVREAYKVLAAKLQGLKGQMQEKEKAEPGSVNTNALRYISLAFTELEASGMWAVKSIVFARDEKE